MAALAYDTESSALLTTRPCLRQLGGTLLSTCSTLRRPPGQGMFPCPCASGMTSLLSAQLPQLNEDEGPGSEAIL